MFCAQCGAPNEAPAKFCFKCGAPLVQAAPSASDPRTRTGASPVAVTEPRVATGKNPILATVLSLVIVGLGQFYNGDTKKGAVMLGIAAVLALVTAGVAWLAIAIWSAVDAYRVASGTASRW